MLRTERRSSDEDAVAYETVVWDDATGDWEILDYADGDRLVRRRRCVYERNESGDPVRAEIETVRFDAQGRETDRETTARLVDAASSSHDAGRD